MCDVACDELLLVDMTKSDDWAGRICKLVLEGSFVTYGLRWWKGIREVR